VRSAFAREKTKADGSFSSLLLKGEGLKRHSAVFLSILLLLSPSAPERLEMPGALCYNL